MRCTDEPSPPLKKPPGEEEEEWRKVGMPCMGIMSVRYARPSTQIKGYIIHLFSHLHTIPDGFKQKHICQDVHALSLISSQHYSSHYSPRRVSITRCHRQEGEDLNQYVSVSNFEFNSLYLHLVHLNNSVG